MLGDLIIALLSILFGVFILRLPRGRRIEGAEPRCATCGYIVIGLPEPTCPECGADLQRPGAVLTGGRRPPGRIVRSIAWSAFCVFAVAVPISAIWPRYVEPLVPRLRDVSIVLTFAQPKSGAYRSIELRSDSHALAGLSAPLRIIRTAKIDLRRSDGTICTAVVDDAAEHFHPPDKDGSKDQLPLDAAGLTAWLRTNGVTGNEAQINKEMASAVTQMRQAILQAGNGISVFGDGATFSSVGSSSGSSSSPQKWVGIAPPVIVGTVWLIGLIYIIAQKPLTLSSGQRASGESFGDR